jgi:hypothetical protein
MTGAVVVGGLLLFVVLAVWARFGARAAGVMLLVAGVLVGYMFYAGVFNTTTP